MGPRLLAYGGVRFSERRRIGEWQRIPEGTLRDPYGLQTACWSFGAGTAGGAAFLILRRLQRFESRVYAYTLLIDPGVPIWNLFEWNGAAIIDALIQAEPEAGGLLFTSPENCTDSALLRILDGLQRQPAENADPVSDRFQAMLAGSAGMDRPLVVGLAEMGLAERPPSAIVSRYLQELPVCFRLSQGWLVGGGSLHGDVLGARFVIDDSADGLERNGVDAESSGRRYVAAWNDLGKTSVLDALVASPLFAWPTPAKIALDGLTLLSDLRGAVELSDELLVRIKDRAPAFPAVDSAIDKRKVELLLSGNAPLGPAQTVELTETALAEGLTLDEDQTSRLARPALIEYLVKRFDTPNAIPAAFRVPRGVRLALWERAIEHAKDGEVEQTFAQAIRAEVSQLSDAEISRLAGWAIQSLASTDESLAGWKQFQQKSRLWHHLEEPLRQTALHRLKRGVMSAPEDYLQIADDPGGLLAAGFLGSRELAESLVSGIWKLRKKHEKLVRLWIEKLAESPLRGWLSIGLKEEFLGLREWQFLAALKQILAGQRLDKDSLRTTAEEQEFLAAELKQITLPPKLARGVNGRLQKLLGRHWQGTPEQPDAVDEPLSPAVSEAGERSPAEFLHLFHRLLFEPPEGDDAIQRALDSLRSVHKSVEPAKALDQAGAMVMEAPAEALALFVERFGGQYLQLGKVMENLPSHAQQRLIALLDTGAKGKGLNQTLLKHLTFALDAPSSRNCYSDALGKYVLDQPGLLEKIAGRMGDMNPGSLARSIKGMVTRRQTG